MMSKMKIEFKHKDQTFFEEVCKLLPSFAQRFQEACENQWEDEFNFVSVERKPDTTFQWRFLIPKKDIKRVEVEELDPFVWYPASKWNGNPKQYALVERTGQGSTYLFRGLTHALTAETEFFMLVPQDKDIKPKC